MSGPTTTRRGGDGRWIGGLILILIGAGLLAGQFVPDIGRYAPLVVGLGLLIIFLFTRNAGALIGGAIVTGIGVGLLLEHAVPGSRAAPGSRSASAWVSSASGSSAACCGCPRRASGPSSRAAS